jgi:predicted nucleotidyltransferase
MNELIIKAFNEFDRHISPSPIQRRSALTRTNIVSALVTSNTSVSECIQFGSFARSTSIRDFSDVDILAIFNPADANKPSPETLLNALEEIVTGIHGSSVRTDTNAVTLTYQEGPSVDLVPAIMGDITKQIGPTFLIPSNEAKQWQVYAPYAHDQLIEERATKLGRTFKGSIRMMKWWSKSNGGPLRSSEIENTACNTFTDVIPAYPEAIYALLDSHLRQLSQAEHDEGQQASDISLKTRVLVEDARQMSYEALQLSASTNQDADEAAAAWRRLFGEQFPSIIY